MPLRWPSIYYKLLGRVAVPCTDLMDWARWMETAERVVAKTHIGPIEVSTVFIGLDHGFKGDTETPLIFETMIFRGGDGDETFRCSTWQEAEEQHARAVALVRAEIKEAAK